MLHEDGLSTLERIHAAAKAEFLEKGFQQASLRNIVRTAGVTTGAFYGYYVSKEALFDALVKDAYEYLTGNYRAALNDFAELPMEEQPDQMGSISSTCMRKMLLYMYEHRTEVLLILQCAEGTRYAGFIDELVQLEVESTNQYCEVLGKLGYPKPEIDQKLEHILVTGMMNAYFEIILHNMPMADAKHYLDELIDFYMAGWTKIMGQ